GGRLTATRVAVPPNVVGFHEIPWMQWPNRLGTVAPPPAGICPKVRERMHLRPPSGMAASIGTVFAFSFHQDGAPKKRRKQRWLLAATQKKRLWPQKWNKNTPPPTRRVRRAPGRRRSAASWLATAWWSWWVGSGS